MWPDETNAFVGGSDIAFLQWAGCPLSPISPGHQRRSAGNAEASVNCRSKDAGLRDQPTTTGRNFPHFHCAQCPEPGGTGATHRSHLSAFPLPLVCDIFPPTSSLLVTGTRASSGRAGSKRKHRQGQNLGSFTDHPLRSRASSFGIPGVTQKMSRPTSGRSPATGAIAPDGIRSSSTGRNVLRRSTISGAPDRRCYPQQSNGGGRSCRGGALRCRL